MSQLQTPPMMAPQPPDTSVRDFTKTWVGIGSDLGYMRDRGAVQPWEHAEKYGIPDAVQSDDNALGKHAKEHASVYAKWLKKNHPELDDDTVDGARASMERETFDRSRGAVLNEAIRQGHAMQQQGADPTQGLAATEWLPFAGKGGKTLIAHYQKVAGDNFQHDAATPEDYRMLAFQHLWDERRQERAKGGWGQQALNVARGVGPTVGEVAMMPGKLLQGGYQAGAKLAGNVPVLKNIAGAAGAGGVFTALDPLPAVSATYERQTPKVSVNERGGLEVEGGEHNVATSALKSLAEQWSSNSAMMLAGPWFRGKGAGIGTKIFNSAQAGGTGLAAIEADKELNKALGLAPEGSVFRQLGSDDKDTRAAAWKNIVAQVGAFSLLHGGHEVLGGNPEHTIKTLTPEEKAKAAELNKQFLERGLKPEGSQPGQVAQQEQPQYGAAPQVPGQAQQPGYGMQPPDRGARIDRAVPMGTGRLPEQAPVPKRGRPLSLAEQNQIRESPLPETPEEIQAELAHHQQEIENESARHVSDAQRSGRSPASVQSEVQRAIQQGIQDGQAFAQTETPPEPARGPGAGPAEAAGGSQADQFGPAGAGALRGPAAGDELSRINEVGRQLPDQFGKPAQDAPWSSHKVFVSKLYDTLKPNMSLDEFKQQLLKAHQEGKLRLARTDMVGEVRPEDQADLKRSQISHLNATFDAVDIPRPAPAPPTQPTFKNRSDMRRGEQVVTVDANKLDAAWSKDNDYIPKGGGGTEVPSSRAGVEKFIASGRPIETPRVHFREDGSAMIEDGRHRFAVLRDHGADKIAITVNQKQAERYGSLLASPAPPTQPEALHGSPKPNLKEIQPSGGDYGPGVYFTTELGKAEDYSRGRKEIAKYVLGERSDQPPVGRVYTLAETGIKNPLKIVSEKQYEQLLGDHDDSNRGIAKWAKEQGYDGILNEVTKEHIAFTDKPLPVKQAPPEGQAHPPETKLSPIDRLRARQKGVQAAPVEQPGFAGKAHLPEAPSEQEKAAEANPSKYADLPQPERDRVEKIVESLKGVHDPEAVRQSAVGIYDNAGKEGLDEWLKTREEHFPRFAPEEVSEAKRESKLAGFSAEAVQQHVDKIEAEVAAQVTAESQAINAGRGHWTDDGEFVEHPAGGPAAAGAGAERPAGNPISKFLADESGSFSHGEFFSKLTDYLKSMGGEEEKPRVTPAPVPSHGKGYVKFGTQLTFPSTTKLSPKLGADLGRVANVDAATEHTLRYMRSVLEVNGERLSSIKTDSDKDRLYGAVVVQRGMELLRAAGGNPGSLIGQADSPLKTGADYQRGLKEMEDFFQTSGKTWAPLMNRFFKELGGDPASVQSQIPEFPVQRINLDRDAPGAVSTGSSLAKTRLRRGGFMKEAELSGETYDLSLNRMMEQTLRGHMTNAFRAKTVATGIDQGVYNVVEGKGSGPEGWRELMFAKSDNNGQKWLQSLPKGSRIFAHPDAYTDTLKAFGVSESPGDVIGKAIGDAIGVKPQAGLLGRFTSIALTTPSELATHVLGNIPTALFKEGMGVRGAVEFGKNLYLDLAKDPEYLKSLSKLAEINAAFESRQPTGIVSPYLPHDLRFTDPSLWFNALSTRTIDLSQNAMRVALSHAYDRMAESGRVVKSVAGKRDFVNQKLGNYNKKASNAFINLLKDTGMQPFATAATTFTEQGVRAGLGGIPDAPAPSWRMTMLNYGMQMAKLSPLLVVGPLLNSLNHDEAFPDDVPPFAVKTGDGKYRDPLQLAGIRRGWTALGIEAAIEAPQRGEGADEAILHGAKDAAHSAMHTLLGPLPDFISTAISGKDTRGYQRAAQVSHARTLKGIQSARARGAPMEGETWQSWENLKAAFIHSNSLLSSLFPLTAKEQELTPAERTEKLLGPIGEKTYYQPKNKRMTIGRVR